MFTARKLARVGATLALALTMVAATTPAFVYADEDTGDSGDSGTAPMVLNTVNAGIQTATDATEAGLGIGEAASGEQGLGIGSQGTQIGAAATGAGIGIPADVLGR
jgi:hypothetical protein